MKRLLLLGGMTPEVTVLYYNTINRIVRSSLGARNNAPLCMYSANLEEMVQFAGSGEWDAFARVYIDAIDSLRGKVDGIVICAILAHKVSAQLMDELSSASLLKSTAEAPNLLHIADFLAQHIKTAHPHIRTLGLLGPKVTIRPCAVWRALWELCEAITCREHFPSAEPPGPPVACGAYLHSPRSIIMLEIIIPLFAVKIKYLRGLHGTKRHTSQPITLRIDPLWPPTVPLAN